MARILVIDDEPTILKVMTMLLKTRQHDVATTDGGEPGKALLLGQEFDLLLTDIRMAGINGLEFLKMAHEKWPLMPVVMMTGYATLDSVQQAIKLGAFDYIKKPLRADELLDLVDRALEYGKGQKAQSTGVQPMDVRCYLGGIVAESQAMKMVCELAKRVAPTPTIILVRGEKGVGKGLVARTLHDLSRRQDKAFVSVDCAGIQEPELVKMLFGAGQSGQEAAFIQADGGTIFLERIESAGPNAQRMLLAALTAKAIVQMQNGIPHDVPMDVRVLASAEMEIKDLVEAGLFLEELHDRLRLIPIGVPPLRERREDILPLVHYLVKQQAGASGQAAPVMDSDVAERFQAHAWPGNVAEMQDVIRHALAQVQGGRITKGALPQTLLSAGAGSAAPAAKKPEERYKTLRTFLHSMGKTEMKTAK